MYHGECASAVSAPSTWGQVPGGAGRWTLPDVNTGLDSMAEVYTRADKMADEMTLYTTVQGITMQLLILRLIKVLSAQKRLSILTTTSVKVCCRRYPCAGAVSGFVHREAGLAGLPCQVSIPAASQD